MINCDKCGFGHKTFEEKRACKSWKEMVADGEAPSPNVALVHDAAHSAEVPKKSAEQAATAPQVSGSTGAAKDGDAT